MRRGTGCGTLFNYFLGSASKFGGKPRSSAFARGNVCTWHEAAQSHGIGNGSQGEVINQRPVANEAKPPAC